MDTPWDTPATGAATVLNLLFACMQRWGRGGDAREGKGRDTAWESRTREEAGLSWLARCTTVQRAPRGLAQTVCGGYGLVSE